MLLCFHFWYFSFLSCSSLFPSSRFLLVFFLPSLLHFSRFLLLIRNFSLTSLFSLISSFNFSFVLISIFFYFFSFSSFSTSSSRFLLLYEKPLFYIFILSPCFFFTLFTRNSFSVFSFSLLFIILFLLLLLCQHPLFICLFLSFFSSTFSFGVSVSFPIYPSVHILKIKISTLILQTF